MSIINSTENYSININLTLTPTQIEWLMDSFKQENKDHLAQAKMLHIGAMGAKDSSESLSLELSADEHRDYALLLDKIASKIALALYRED